MHIFIHFHIFIFKYSHNDIFICIFLFIYSYEDIYIHREEMWDVALNESDSYWLEDTNMS
jgi:hypothetical protein